MFFDPMASQTAPSVENLAAGFTGECLIVDMRLLMVCEIVNLGVRLVADLANVGLESAVSTTVFYRDCFGAKCLAAFPANKWLLIGV